MSRSISTFFLLKEVNFTITIEKKIEIILKLSKERHTTTIGMFYQFE